MSRRAPAILDRPNFLRHLLEVKNGTHPEGNRSDDPRSLLHGELAVIKLFDPCSRYTFFVLEAQRQPDNDLLLFGFCRSPLGPDGDEFGFASLRELESRRGQAGQGIERDLNFKPTPILRLWMEVGYWDSSVPPPP